MAKKKVFVSFDHTYDKHYKFLMQVWDKNPNFEFDFSDHSSDKILRTGASWALSFTQKALLDAQKILKMLNFSII